MNRKLRYSILCADLLWLAATVAVAYWLRIGLSAETAASRVLLSAFVPLVAWTVLYATKDLEGFRGGWRLPHILAQVTVGVFYLIGLLSVLAVVISNLYTPATLLFLGCLLLPGFVSVRCLAWWLFILRSSGRHKRRVIILGSGRIVQELIHKISRHPEMSMEVAGVLFPSDIEPTRRAPSLPPGARSVRTLNIMDLIREKRVQELIVVEPLPPGVETSKLISNCRHAGVLVHLVPQRYELYRSKAKLMEIDDVPLVSMEDQAPPALGLEVKRAIDILGASVLIVVTAPLLLLSATALYLRKGRMLRRELRCGQNGRVFWMYRLEIDRTAPNLSIGERILAQFSLTELPQLWNILKGEMSLVGPRPESPGRAKHYSEWQSKRLSVKPGLTGLAQVNGLREQHSSEEKARFDLEYIFRWSVFLDLSLLLQTVWTFLARLMEYDAIRYAPKPQSEL